MRGLLATFSKAGAITFALCAIIAFTPLSWISQILAIAPEDPFLFWLIVAAIGSPFFGFLFLFLFSKRGRKLEEAARWAGVWIGAIAGSWTGVSLQGMT